MLVTSDGDPYLNVKVWKSPHTWMFFTGPCGDLPSSAKKSSALNIGY